MARRVRYCSSCRKQFIATTRKVLKCEYCSDKCDSANISVNNKGLVEFEPRTKNFFNSPEKRFRFDTGTNDQSDNTSHGREYIVMENDGIHSSSLEKNDCKSKSSEDRNNDFGDVLDIDSLSKSGEEEKARNNDVHISGFNNKPSVGVEYESSISSGCSEAGDDIHCTQLVEEGNFDIVEIDSNSEEEEEEKEISKDLREEDLEDEEEDGEKDEKKEKEATVQDKENRGTDKIDLVIPQESNNNCFICGSSLSRIKAGLNGRLNHIKRCAKKHGVTAHDIKLNDDHEYFTTKSSTFLKKQEHSSNRNITNPYLTSDQNWHGDASKDLNSGSVSKNNDPVKGLKLKLNHKTEQTSVTNFFQAPSKNLNSILMAGSKRMAKTSKLKAELRKSSNGNNNNQNQNLGRKGNRYGGGRSRFDYSKAPCPQYKRITGTDFVCDGFLYAKNSMTKNYFLTHFHSDHYGGITSSWNVGVIYCSLPTANLVRQQLGVDTKYLHPMSMYTPTIIESKGKPITVTLLDANHCPGAVMFLFEIGKRQVLHVGDFRWNRDIMMQQAPLKKLSSLQPRLDEIFLDTTYCDPKYDLPTQEEAIAAAIEVATSEMQNSKLNSTSILMLFGAYTIGKERIYLSVAEKLGTKVYVDGRRYRILSALGWPEERMSMLTTNKHLSRLWVVPLGHINMKQMVSYLTSKGRGKANIRHYDKVIGFRPTGWSMSSKKSGSSSIISSRSSGNLTIHSVPYSEHSSFPELVDCLRCLQPTKITPTVSVSKSQQQISQLLAAVHNYN